MEEDFNNIQIEPQEDTVRQTLDIFASMVSEKREEIQDGPKKCAMNRENLQKLSVKIFTKLIEVSSQLDQVIEIIRENVRTKDNPEGCLLGKFENYTDGLALKLDKPE